MDNDELEREELPNNTNTDNYPTVKITMDPDGNAQAEITKDSKDNSEEDENIDDNSEESQESEEENSEEQAEENPDTEESQMVPPPVIDPSANVYRNARLYKLLNDLLSNIEYFMKIFPSINTDMIFSADYRQLIDNYDQLKQIYDASNTYSKELFTSKSYENNLHTYLLIQKTFIKIIKNFRRILKLDIIQEIPENTEVK